MRLKSLHDESLATIHAAFIAAFSDYSVRIELPYERFLEHLRGRDIRLADSFGVYHETGRLIGFVLNGLRERDGVTTGYDGGTGFLPAYRGQGLAALLFAEMQKELVRRQVRRYLLEVIRDNQPALRLYQKLGFTVTRNLNCYQWQRSAAPAPPVPEELHLAELDLAALDRYQHWLDYQPTWQNATPSILNLKDRYQGLRIMLGQREVGYAVIHREYGDLPQLGLAEELRRERLPLLGMLAPYTRSAVLKAINVEEGSYLGPWLIGQGMQGHVDQYEMAKDLG
ncbi:acetyltransferase (GNAT) family protein [Hydrogenispora ethanolica]|jgi:ribosomal protein S18 acetylase RimI-like enzyme|uniref:Acetyltransferase (GNAT) family protein n=1 Tax=Hydrogenispora ethanolica TaxID=1082276 RepID=A0A4R1SA53_HYDET|nr:GNAT family N-acetyltransferase [Hydrogenispora ethanolica]TCL76383.1 acetyltransferase (GNAT) family protein [Hydrogenispora ethanolica]